MDLLDVIYGLQFHNHQVFHQKIKSIADIDPHPFVNDGLANLAYSLKFTLVKLKKKTAFIRRFQ